MGIGIIRDTLAFLLILSAAAGAQAQNAAEPPNPLSQLKALKCQFPAATSAVWKEGAPQPQTKTQDMRFEINAIDVSDGTAEFMGTAGRAYVTAVLSGWSLYFVESAVGQLNVTTVFSQEAVAEEAQGGAFAARIPADAGGPLRRRAVRFAELRGVRGRPVAP